MNEREELKLTPDERRRIMGGDNTALHRKDRPEVEAGACLVLSWSRGGRQVVDREVGTTIDIPRKPSVWIEVTEVRRQETRWMIRFRHHDHRQHERFLRAGPPSSGRQPFGLKTRLRPPNKVPRREPPESWTGEAERGYSATSKGAVDELSGVPDSFLEKDRIRREVDAGNSAKRMMQRSREKQMQLEGELLAARKRGSRKVVHDITEQLARIAEKVDRAA